jgi:ribokinase
VNKIVVMGSINMDLVAVTPRLPRRGETVPGTDLQYLPGGKGANQAVAAARLGTNVNMLGKVGDDAFAAVLLDFLASRGVNISGIISEHSTPSGAALIVVDDSGENTIVVVPGANGRVRPADVSCPAMQLGDVAVTQFETPLDTVEAFLRAAKKLGCKTLLNPAPARECHPDILDLADILIVNETELEFFSGLSFDNHEKTDVVDAARRLLSRAGQLVVVTLGSRGVLAIENNEVHSIAGHAVSVVDTTGAGDCFVGAFAAATIDGLAIADRLRFANRAASISVQRRGAGPSMPTREEIASFRGDT